MSLNSPSISIVMSDYNVGQFIDACIQSILTQTFSDFELIIVDDGSTDNSVDIIKTYNDERITLIENSHDFIGSLNLGIARAKGKYIARMDSDDIMMPNRLEVQYNYMESNSDIDICGGWMEIMDGNSTTVEAPITHDEICFNLLFSNCLFNPTILIRRKKLSELSFYPNIYKSKYIYAEDYKLWTDLIKESFRFATLPEILFKYRIWENQVSTQFKYEMAAKRDLIQAEYIDILSEKITEKNIHLRDFINNAIALFNERKLSFMTLKRIIGDIYIKTNTIK